MTDHTPKKLPMLEIVCVRVFFGFRGMPLSSVVCATASPARAALGPPLRPSPPPLSEHVLGPSPSIAFTGWESLERVRTCCVQVMRAHDVKVPALRRRSSPRLKRG